jgi:hypothetical protein
MYITQEMNKMFRLKYSGSVLTNRSVATIVIIGIVIFSVAGCRGKSSGEGKIEAGAMTETAEARTAQGSNYPIRLDKYAAWDTITVGKVKIIYPSGHHLAESFQSTGEGYPHAIGRICDFLDMVPPRETLLVYYYTGIFHGRAVTGKDWTFATDSAIHFWLPGYLGPPLVEYITERWVARDTKHRFLKEGMMTLFDFSGQNYFKFMDNFLKTDSLIPLSKLAADTATNVYTERWQSAEAATFVDFVVYTWGAEGLRALWQTQDPFEKAVPKLLNISVDEMQEMWLEFVRKTNDGTLDADTSAG